MGGWGGAQHAGIVRMFVASDSVRLARQTKGFQSDEDVDQCRFFREDESLGRAWGGPEGLLVSRAEQRLVGSLIKYRIGTSLLRRKEKWCSTV